MFTLYPIHLLTHVYVLVNNHGIYTGDKIEKNEIGGACSAYGVWERRVQGFGVKTLGKETNGNTRCRWQDNIKADLQEEGYGVMDWIEVTHDRDRWRALVNVVMNLRVP
jgi:hypothetical protein